MYFKKDALHLIDKYSKSISQIEAELLLACIFKCGRQDLYINNYSVDGEIEGIYCNLIERRLSGEPLQYVTGTSEFMGLEFIVNKDVFIPRPETEILVKEVLRASSIEDRGSNYDLKILDLCTGCGNIAITLARLIPNSQIAATDISGPALKTANKNSIIHETDKGITFYKGDLFHALPFDKGYKFDIIVCNPPYIKRSELEFLQREVKSEPKTALDGGVEGMDFYRRIAGRASDYLKPNGSLFLEIGFGEREEVEALFVSEGYAIKKITKDFSGVDRVVWINLS